MGLFSKKTLFNDRPQFAEVDIAGLGTVRLRAISTADYFTLQEVSSKAQSLPADKLANPDQATMATILYELYPVIIALAVVDEEGKPVFTGPDDPDLLLMRPNDLAAIGNAAHEFWGFTSSTPIEAAVKN